MIKIIFAVVVLLFVWQVGRLLALKGDLSSYGTYWLDNNEVVPEGEYITYIALGDSAAQGIGASKPSNGYVGIVAKEIGLRYKKPVRVINLSKSGARAKDVAENQLPQLAKFKPDIVTVAVGGNDVNRYDKAVFEESIDTIVAALPTGSIMANVPNFGGGRMHSHKALSFELASYVNESVKKRNDIILADLHTQTIKMEAFGTYGADFFHPSDKGYRIWSEAFIQQL